MVSPCSLGVSSWVKNIFWEIIGSSLCLTEAQDRPLLYTTAAGGSTDRARDGWLGMGLWRGLMGCGLFSRQDLPCQDLPGAEFPGCPWAVPLPEQVLQTSCCTLMLYKYVLQTVLGMGTGMNVTAQSPYLLESHPFRIWLDRMLGQHNK